MTVKRLMPEQINLGRAHSTTMGHPMNFYRQWKEDPAKQNPHGLRTVMGFCLPPWQRGLVWTDQQKISFIESAWKGISLGTFSYNYASIGSPLDNLLIDGQQRMSAIEDYVNDKFKVFGYLWSEVTEVDRRIWGMSTTFASYETRTENEEYLRDYYNLMNFGGTAHKEGEQA